VASAGNPFFVSPWGIDLTAPPRMPITGRPDQGVLRKIAKLESLFPALSIFSHVFILSRGTKRKHRQSGGEEVIK